MTEIENSRILSFKTDTQDIVTTIISVYGPQENDLFEEKTKFYDVIAEIQRAYTRSPYVLVVCNLNVKLKNNLQNIHQIRKVLEQAINDFNMNVANTLPICESRCTRVTNKNLSERSIIDYLSLSEKLEPNLKKLLIDESKSICSDKETNDKKTHSDHNAFIFSMHMKIKKRQLLQK